jgi:two-component system NtrC family sensor kinase
LFLFLVLGSTALWLLGRARRPGFAMVQVVASVLAGGAILGAGVRGWLPWLAPLGSLLVVAGHLVLTRRHLDALEAERTMLARQVDRRINEIFSLQELSYILAESLQTERIAGQVVRYVLRFLNAEGALVALTDQKGTPLVVAAAEGSLQGQVGQTINPSPTSLIHRAASSDRIEVIGLEHGEGAELVPSVIVESGAAAPLRAHGLTMGVLAVANRRAGSFTAEDLWLLSTVATHVAVVMANSRLFELVRQAKEEWETAFNALTEGIAVLDSAGRVVRGNQALARLLDVPPPAVLGIPFWSRVVGEAEGEDQLVGAARRGERAEPYAIRSTTLNRVLRLTAAALGEPAPGAAVVVLVEDVTEQRALEAQLIQSEKLAAVGQLVSGVAHELNNPLTSIAGLSEFLAERGTVPATEQEHLRVIREQAERAGRIIRNLLTFARKGTSGDTVIDLNDIAARTVSLVAYEVRLRGVELVEHRVPGPLLVRGDRDELQQVVLNLVNNAVQALRTLPDGAPRRVTLFAGEEHGEALIRVRDTGPGVPAAMVAQLFTPFFTTKDPGQGTGLGLSLSFRIIESHGGRLAYRPGPDGTGAEFWFALPLAEGRPTDEAPAAMEPAPPVPGRSGRAVLLIDSDSGAELVLRALFEPAGHVVDVARNGVEAQKRLASRRYEIVVLDPAVSADGRSLLVDRLVGRPGPRVLVTTTDSALAERCRALGVTVLPRPFLPRDLVEFVGDLLQNSQKPQGTGER